MPIIPVPPVKRHSLYSYAVDNSSTAINAANKNFSCIGRMYTQDGANHVLSAAGGGEMWFRAGGVTFADGGTVLQVSLQAVGSTGFPSGTPLVYGVLTGGVDTITATAWRKVPMTTGSHTVVNKDLYANVVGFTTRGGSDSVGLMRANGAHRTFSGNIYNWGFPYGAQSDGPLKVQNLPFVFIKFDDNTYGWIEGLDLPGFVVPTAESFSTSSSYDEYGGSFEPQVPMRISLASFLGGAIATADTHSVCVYSDPYGTPTLLSTYTPDPNKILGTSSHYDFWTPIEVGVDYLDLDAGETYLISLLATSANAITFNYMDMTTGFEGLKVMVGWPFSNLKMARRDGSSGAFAVYQDYYLPGIGVEISGLDDGSGGGPGGERQWLLG